ncbi:MAG: calcium-binding protein [Pseudomonadota bacterium]
MARFLANRSFDILSINLDEPGRNAVEVDFSNNINEVFNGIRYEDTYGVFTDSGFGLYVGGTGFRVNNQDDLVGGRATGLGEVNPDTGAIRWIFEDISLSASRLYQAAITRNNNDELDLLERALSGDDRIILSDDNDRMRGFDGDDRMFGNGGRDDLRGDDGDDVLRGGNGKDDLFGNNGNDVIRGDGGNDDLSGGRGRDVLIGGDGKDRMDGGRGNDRFEFNDRDDSGRGNNADRIRDFERGDDEIDLRDLVGGKLDFIRNDDFDGSGRQVRIEDNGRNVTVEIDLNGNGRPNMEIDVLDVGTLGKADFLL